MPNLPTEFVWMPEPAHWQAGDGWVAFEAHDPRAWAPPDEGLFPGSAGLDWAWALRGHGDARLPLHWDVDPALGPQAYHLRIEAQGIRIRAGDAQGAWFGALTLGQWLPTERATPGRLRELTVDDHPAIGRRGYMLDISRDRVPTLASLLNRLDGIARLKGNHVELYMEHTFAYAGHETVHAGYSPLTVQDVQVLQTHARTRGIELVPNQNTFGHMHRWLRWPRYRGLAETEAGDFHAFDHQKEPFSLCPTDARSLDLVRDLFDQLLPLFDSPLVQGGLDETFDVGRGRSAHAARRQGIGPLYAEYLNGVAELARSHGKRLVYWADIVLEHPEMLESLPADGIAVLWGYEADHPLDEQAATLKQQGREFWVAPGTSAWQSLTGRWNNAQANIEAAIDAALRHGAAGAVLTDWGDYGHWQPAQLSEPACLAFFCRAWNPSAPLEDRPEGLVQGLRAASAGRRSLALAQVWMDIVTAYELLGDGARNGTGPFYALRYPPHGPNPKETWTDRAPHFSQEGVQAYRARLAQLRERLRLLASAKDSGDSDRAELDQSLWAADWATQVAEHRLAGRPIPGSLAQEGRAMIDRFCQLWLQSSRPGGLYDARRKWEHALDAEEWNAEPLAQEQDGDARDPQA